MGSPASQWGAGAPRLIGAVIGLTGRSLPGIQQCDNSLTLVLTWRARAVVYTPQAVAKKPQLVITKRYIDFFELLLKNNPFPWHERRLCCVGMVTDSGSGSLRLLD